MIKITPIERTPVKSIECPSCGYKVKLIGLLKDSKIKGLSFKCRQCGKLWEVKSE